MARVPTPRDELLELVLTEHTELLPAVLERMRGEIPSYGRLDRAQLVPEAESTFQRLLRAIVERRELGAAELAMLTAHGEARGRQGVPVTDMFRGWRMAVRLILEETVAVGQRSGVPDRELLALSQDLLAITDAAIVAMAHGHRIAEAEQTRHDQHRRADLVRGILFGTLGPAEIRIQVERYGLAADVPYRAVRGRPTAALPAATLARLLEAAPDGARPRGLLAVIDGDIAGFIEMAPTGDIPAAVGLGSPAPLERIEPSFRRATRAMITADAFGRNGVHELSDLGLLPAVLADTEVGDEIMRRYVTPLGESDSAAALLDTVEHYLSNGMRADLTAAELRLHANSVRYRLRRFEQLTGVELSDPGRTLEVWWALQRRRVRRSRTASTDAD
ncbi:PucR family transcriptional regulator [Nocardia sp. NBC_00511]|uniref:PucR family transcriptional regulator n=1 Tax=Nocardia sp. NBC_00511 TaxID=2903591 RepID=UPI0030E5559A